MTAQRTAESSLPVPSPTSSTKSAVRLAHFFPHNQARCLGDEQDQPRRDDRSFCSGQLFILLSQSELPSENRRCTCIDVMSIFSYSLLVRRRYSSCPAFASFTATSLQVCRMPGSAVYYANPAKTAPMDSAPHRSSPTRHFWRIRSTRQQLKSCISAAVSCKL
jgi:hypothetical protein